MSRAQGWSSVKRQVPGRPRRRFVLFGLRDYLMFDAPNLIRLRVRSRGKFRQYVMKVEETRAERGRRR